MAWLTVYAVALLVLTFGATGAVSAQPLDEPAGPGTRPAADARKIKLLIVDGFSNHDWRRNTRLLRGILEPSGVCEVTVSTAPEKAAAPGWDAWRPRFADYDVVVQTCNDINGGPQWPDEVRAAFVEFVRTGGGVYIYHSGNNAFPTWPEYDEVIGLGWRGANAGTALELSADGDVTRVPPGRGRGTGHGPRTEVLVRRLGEHPIHAGLPRAWRSPDLEVYYYARGPAKNVEVLAYGRDERFKQHWPLEWTVTFGQGRVYNSTYGHVWAGDAQPPGMRCAGVQTLMLRAVQWLANRPVTVPVPADFPTAERASVRGEIPTPE